MARLPHPWNKALALAVVVGHTAGIYGWLALRNYWYTIPTFILVGILTVACWQKAEPLGEREEAWGTEEMRSPDSQEAV